MYGKIENNNLKYAPNPINKDGKTIYNPSVEMLLELGYKPIIRMEYPTDGKQYKQEYVETDDSIIVMWKDDYQNYWRSTYENKTEYEEKQAVYADLVDNLIRRKYSVSAELAILRQRDMKYAEFLEYNDYAESCKVEAKSILGIY